VPLDTPYTNFHLKLKNEKSSSGPEADIVCIGGGGAEKMAFGGGGARLTPIFFLGGGGWRGGANRLERKQTQDFQCSWYNMYILAIFSKLYN
jgi:hypothetical protein